jgi:hypothetical protein
MRVGGGSTPLGVVRDELISNADCDAMSSAGSDGAVSAANCDDEGARFGPEPGEPSIAPGPELGARFGPEPGIGGGTDAVFGRWNTGGGVVPRRAAGVEPGTGLAPRRSPMMRSAGLGGRRSAAGPGEIASSRLCAAGL